MSILYRNTRLILKTETSNRFRGPQGRYRLGHFQAEYPVQKSLQVVCEVGNETA